jgi:lysozyme
VWTFGFGSTRDAEGKPVTATTPAISRDDAVKLMIRDLQAAVDAVIRLVQVPLTEGELAALTDFVYNLGAGSLAPSTLLKLLNAGDYAGAAQQLPLWDHAGGKVLAGLLARRQAELALFGVPPIPAR